MGDLDTAIFRMIHGIAGRSVALDVIGIFFARNLIWIMGAALFCWAVFAARKDGAERERPRRALVVIGSVFAVVMGLFSKAMFGLLWFRPRPFVAFSDVVPLISVNPASQAMPSGHATAAFAIAMSVALVDRRIGTWFLVAAAAVAFGRVFVGAHYPSDVIVGAGVGTLWAYAARALLSRFKRMIIPNP